MRHAPSSIVIDTLGNAFVYPAFRLLCPATKVISYTHYPFISEEMISKVAQGLTSFNNNQGISRSPLLTAAKLTYYRGLLKVYGWCGGMIGVSMANSKWTTGHLQRIWKNVQINLVYPPCDVEPFLAGSGKSKRTRDIVSLSQFRPEKNHQLQLESFAKFIKESDDVDNDNVNLLMIGGCRDESDRQRVKDLKLSASNLGIAHRVHFKTDLPFNQVCFLLKTSFIGLHTMREEHFGISIVEFMAAGLITLANASGGPKDDIIEPGVNGFLASDAEEYAEVLRKIYKMNQDELNDIRENAVKKAATEFSLPAFHKSFIRLIGDLYKYLA